MTAAEAKRLGTREEKDRGERIWTETSSLRLAEVAEKYRHKKNWDVLAYESADSKWDEKKGRWDIKRTQIPAEHHATFKKAYIKAGVEVIEENVQDAIKSGWLQDLA